MSYQKVSDVKPVVLGGTNKETGKKNPSELEGYFLRTETRPNKFNKTTPQNLYVFLTEEGEVGLYGKGGLNKEMRKAVLGRMTKVVNTGKTLDIGKGNPMILFEVFQDRNNTIDVSDHQVPTHVEAQQEAEEDQDLFEGELKEQEAYETASTPPRAPASAPSQSQRQRVQDLINRSKTR